MKCFIVKDLLPSYIDGLSREETNAEIRKHLDECADCRCVYNKMTAEIPHEVPQEDKDIDFLKKLKAKILRKNLNVAFTTCFLVLACIGGAFAFSFYYETPIVFDGDHMKVEVVQTAVIETEDADGSVHKSWRVLVGDKPEDGAVVRDELTLAHHNLPKYKTYVYGRDINRGGENIRVVYYCYSKTLIISFLYIQANYSNGSTGNYFGSALHGADYEQKTIEAYYLPNLHKIINIIEKLSDEKFDSQRSNGTLVWSGVIPRIANGGAELITINSMRIERGFGEGTRYFKYNDEKQEIELNEQEGLELYSMVFVESVTNSAPGISFVPLIN